MKNHTICLTLVTLAVGLTGCGNGEPSEKEMLSALSQVDPGNNNGLTKSSCEKTGDHTYKCGFIDKKANGPVINYNFTKVDGKWQIAVN